MSFISKSRKVSALFAAALFCLVSLAAQQAPVNPVIEWNRTLLTIVRTPGAQPATIHPTRSFAILHAAIYDAVNAIDQTHKPYLVHLAGVSKNASQDAAADAAAHKVLLNLYPAFQTTLDNQLQQDLAQIPDSNEKTEGVNVGTSVADQILAIRNHDGSSVPGPVFVPVNVPGTYQLTPTNFKPAQFTGWSKVTPFALEAASQFRPGPPPALTSDRYSDDFNQLKSLGILNSTAATADQKLQGKFWNGNIQNYWNEISQTAALAHNLNTARSARLFALVNFSVADTVIAFYDAKYVYNFWRPVTAIRAADPATNPATIPDPNWLPENINTAPDPSYPGAHAAISHAAATILDSFFDSERIQLTVTSEVLPGVVRTFNGFRAAADEATASRIFSGQHFNFDLTAGKHLGNHVADFTFDNLLTRRHGDDGDGH
ncbi:MAG TPA: vanadium-dependent haloperoxidase [Candidatus Angelobacter sp.]|nr:vanadium-dependent haloperoxidase [Candidatus Angelobacter sp.]